MTAFVLGNGVSRLSVDVNHLLTRGAVYGCNALFRTHTPTALVATDAPIAREIQESGYSAENRFYTRRPLPRLGGLEVPKEYFGFSSGPIAVAIAVQDFCNPIYLVGFDMGPNTAGRFNNVYAGTTHYKPVEATPTYTGNWVKQLTKIMDKNRDHRFIRVYGETTARILELDAIPNLTHLPMHEFLSGLNR